MHLNPNIDINEFLKVVSTCKGDVLFETPEGDQMNLKSELCRFVFASGANVHRTLVRRDQLQKSGGCGHSERLFEGLTSLHQQSRGPLFSGPRLLLYSPVILRTAPARWCGPERRPG